MTLSAPEGFLGRLSASRHRDAFVLKGGVLLAAFGCRRPTRDIDLLMRDLDSDQDTVFEYVRQLASTAQNDGLLYDAEHATAKVI